MQTSKLTGATTTTFGSCVNSILRKGCVLPHILLSQFCDISVLMLSTECHSTFMLIQISAVGIYRIENLTKSYICHKVK